jgi:MarR family
MAALSYAPDWTRRMTELAELTSGSLPRLSQVVTKLEGRGWVRRRADPKDGRVTLAVLTKAGFRKLEESAQGHVETLRRLVFDPSPARRSASSSTSIVASNGGSTRPTPRSPPRPSTRTRTQSGSGLAEMVDLTQMSVGLSEKC